MGKLDLIICMDAGCGDYTHLWNTVSLRGVVNTVLSVRLLKESVHSGSNGGIAADTFNVCRQLLDRLEDPKTGKMLNDLYVEITPQRLEQAKNAAAAMGDGLWKKVPFIATAKPLGDTKENFEILLNNTWRPTLAITGADGLPQIS